MAVDHEVDIITGQIASDHVHLFIAYRPTQNISKIEQWLNGISSRLLLSEFPHLKRQFWGRHFWAPGYLLLSSGKITDELVQHYIDEQDGESEQDDSRFAIDS